MARSNLVILTLLFFLFFVDLGESYRVGDVVWGSTKVGLINKGQKEPSQKESIPWEHLTSKNSPRFGVDKTALFPIDIQKFKTGEILQVVFSFEDGRFRTPWITVGDFTDMEKPLFLEFITFDFVYSGNEIVSAKWKIEYGDFMRFEGKYEYEFTIYYRWEERQQHDVRLTMNLLLIFGIAAAAIYVLWIFGNEEKTQQYIRQNLELARNEMVGASSSGSVLKESAEKID